MLRRILLFSLCTLQALATRPFYLMGHMANSLGEVDDFINSGANAIEADLKFHQDGTVNEFHHGFPCDCLPFPRVMRKCGHTTPADRFLWHIRDIGTPGNPKYKDSVVLLYLDTKLGKVNNYNYINAGENLARLLSEHFFNTGVTRVKLIVAIEGVEQIDFYRGFIPRMRDANPSAFENIGYDIYTRSGNYNEINDKLKSVGITSRTWQSTGLTTCLKFSSSKYMEALRLRDDPHSYIKKFIVWTLDREDSLKEALNLNVDSIMTNNVRRLYKVVGEFREKYHLATHNDDPWAKVIA